MATNAHIREALRDVVDPELGVNIVDLGLVSSATERWVSLLIRRASQKDAGQCSAAIIRSTSMAYAIWA